MLVQLIRARDELLSGQMKGKYVQGTVEGVVLTLMHEKRILFKRLQSRRVDDVVSVTVAIYLSYYRLTVGLSRVYSCMLRYDLYQMCMRYRRFVCCVCPSTHVMDSRICRCYVVE